MAHIFIVDARFYTDISDQLAEAAIAELEAADMTYDRYPVPGTFELPAAVAMAIESRKYDGYIALGCVIRGETSHYDYVCSESARGLADLAKDHQVPVGFGVITAENQEQARVRSDKNQKNVGGGAAKACIAMLSLKEELAA